METQSNKITLKETDRITTKINTNNGNATVTQKAKEKEIKKMTMVENNGITTTETETATTKTTTDRTAKNKSVWSSLWERFNNMGFWNEEARGKIIVHLLVIIFGITSWSIMNGLWVELPILVSHLPEGWALPSYLTIVAQFGNLGPILFSLISYFRPKKKLETPTSVMVVGALSLCALLYAFFWKETMHIAGSEFSVALLILTFSQATFAATTSMCYLAFMAHLRSCYMSSIFIGMGFSGLIPAFAAIGQGYGSVYCIPNSNSSTTVEGETNSNSGNDSIIETYLQPVEIEPAFTVQMFFIMLFAIGTTSLVALLLLIYHPSCKTEHVDTDKEENCQLMDGDLELKKVTKYNRDGPNDEETANDIQYSAFSNRDKNLTDVYPSSPNTPVFTQLPMEDRTEVAESLHYDTDIENSKDIAKGAQEGIKASEEAHNTDKQGKQLGKRESWYLLGLLVWINVLQTSYVLAIQVYSSLPYGLYFYNAVTKAENIVDPIACFVSLFVSAKTTKVITGLTLLGTLFTAYIITVAAMSPHPILENQTSGGVLVLVAWVMCTLLMVYAKVSIAGVMRSQGRTSLLYTGGSTQIGALIGAILAYVMINHLNVFKDGPWCES